MSQHQPNNAPKPDTPPDENPLSKQQASQLSDKEIQEAYRKAYLAQLRQQQCPGCGEEELF